MLIKEGFKYPKFYGFAYEVPEKRSSVCYLFPFNHVVGLCYILWDKIRHAEYVITYRMKRQISQRSCKTKLFKDIELDGKRYLVVYDRHLCEIVKGMARETYKC